MPRTPAAPAAVAATLVALALQLLLPASRASAWSNKEHIQLTRLAAERLVADPDTPPAMKEWLKAAVPDMRDMAAEKDYFLRQRIGIFPRGDDGISYWVTVPDMIALSDPRGGEKKVEPYGVSERLLHFIDLEFFTPDVSKRSYSDDLSHKPSLADFPRDMKDERYTRSGMLPFRVEQTYNKLVEMIRAGKLTDAPGQYPRDEHAAKWAGFLAHYAQDNTQPQHATIDYKSSHYFKDVKAKRSIPNVHADMEYRLMDDENDDYMEVRTELWDLLAKALDEVKDPVETRDPWQATLEVALISYDALPLIGRAGRAAYGVDAEGKVGEFDAAAFAHTKGKFGGQEMTLLEMKARQMAWAVKRTERLWRQAWEEGNR